MGVAEHGLAGLAFVRARIAIVARARCACILLGVEPWHGVHDAVGVDDAGEAAVGGAAWGDGAVLRQAMAALDVADDGVEEALVGPRGLGAPADVVCVEETRALQGAARGREIGAGVGAARADGAAKADAPRAGARRVVGAPACAACACAACWRGQGGRAGGIPPVRLAAGLTLGGAFWCCALRERDVEHLLGGAARPRDAVRGQALALLKGLHALEHLAVRKGRDGPADSARAP